MEVDNKNVKIRNILNKDFLEVELYAVADHYPNRNNSAFTLESMKDALPSFYNKPILGSFRYDDFQGHESNYVVDAESGEGYFDNSKPYDEVPLGLITESSKIEIVKGPDGANWIKFNGYLWVKYATKQILSLLRKRKGRTRVSIECEVLQNHMDGNIEVIDKFNLLGVTILGSYKGFNGEQNDILEGIKGANMRVLNFSANPEFQEKLAQLTFAVQELENANKNILKQNINYQSDDSIENEKTEETGFENEVGSDDRKEKSLMFSEMTMGEKLQILNKFYHDKHKEEDKCCWVCDVDENYAYIRIEDSALKIPFEVVSDENGKIQDVIFDMDNAEKVVQSWKTYADSQEPVTKVDGMLDEKVLTMSENTDNAENTETPATASENAETQTFAESAGDNSAAIEAESGIVMVLESNGNDNDNDHDDNDDCDDNDHDGANDGHDDDDHDDNDDDDNHENHSAEGDCQENCSENTEESHEECSEGCADNFHEENACEGEHVEEAAENSDGTNEENTETCSAEQRSESNTCQFVKIGDENVDINQLFERYTALSADYVSLTNDYSELANNFNTMKTEFDALKADAETARVDSLIAFANGLIDEESFSDDQKANMKMSVQSGIEDGSLADEEAIQKFSVNMFAMALYEAHKANRANNSESDYKPEKKEEFVQSIVKPTTEKSKLAIATEKLKNI